MWDFFICSAGKINVTTNGTSCGASLWGQRPFCEEFAGGKVRLDVVERGDGVGRFQSMKVNVSVEYFGAVFRTQVAVGALAGHTKICTPHAWH